MSLHLPAQFSAKQAVKADNADNAVLEKVGLYEVLKSCDLGA